MKWLRDHALGLAALLATACAFYVSARVDARVVPVEHKIDEHLRIVAHDREYMIRFAEWSAQTLFALCKVQPDARCLPPPVGPSR